ncbi:MAG TPA: DUF4870 domain-containing protein [Pyrinomonadaceae bacterium]|nr:DUF4870 domain-containing protein [Pyrinomonadaceae bacterium]
MQNPPPVQTTTKSSTGLDENIAALLSYVFGWVSGLIFFLIEKDSRLVRFHAMQSILLNVCIAILGVVIWIITFVLIIIGAAAGDVIGMIFSLLATLIWVVFSIALLIAWIMCLIKAFQSQYFKLPVIGNLAEKFSAK